MTGVSKICPACYLRITWIIENVGYLHRILIKLKLANSLARAFDLVFSDSHISIYNTYNMTNLYKVRMRKICPACCWTITWLIEYE